MNFNNWSNTNTGCTGRNRSVHPVYYELLCMLFLLITTAIHGAGPVVHVYGAELFFQHCRPYYSKREKAAFIRGTLFPDIRYIAGLPRNSTHTKKVTLAQVCAEPDPFRAGKLFHSYIDDQRAQRSWKEGMHRHILYENKQNSHLQKVVEDEICYSKICARCTLNALKSYESPELQDGVSFYHTLIYQSNLTDYLRQSPRELFRTRASTKRGYLLLNLPTVQEWSSLIENYAKDTKVIQYVQTLVSELETNIRLHKQKKDKKIT